MADGATGQTFAEPRRPARRRRGCATTSAASGERSRESRRCRHRPGQRRDGGARCRCPAPRRCEAAVEAARAAQPGWRAVPPQQRARAVLALREELLTRGARSWSALVSADMGKTLADADGEVGRGIESVESAAAIPHLLKGENLEGVASGRRRRDGPPAGRRGRRDHPVQLPGDDPALVPALRDRLRQHLHPQALRAGPAPGGADRRGRSTRSRRSRPASSTSSTAAATR